MAKAQARAKIFEEGNLDEKRPLEIPNQIEARVLLGDNIHQQDQQVRKWSHHHLEEGPGVTARHSIEHPVTTVSDNKNKWVPVLSVGQHEVTNTLQN